MRFADADAARNTDSHRSNAGQEEEDAGCGVVPLNTESHLSFDGQCTVVSNSMVVVPGV